MKILKAFLLTALFIAIKFAISYSLRLFNDSFNFEISSMRFLKTNSGFVSYIISFIVLFFISKIKFKWDNGIKKVKSLNLEIIIYLLILNVGLFFLDRPFFDFSKILNTINDIPIKPRQNYQGSNISLLYKIIVVVIMAPIFEELFFRKHMFVELSKKYSHTISIIISSICFSIIHLPNYRNLIPAFLFGVFSCLIYSKTRNILYSILIHFFFNLTWLINLKFGANILNCIMLLEYSYLYWILVLLGVLTVYSTIRKISTVSKGYD